MAQERRTFRFVHTADLHLDSPLRSLALRDRSLRDLIDGASRHALARLVDLCIEESADALLIAGDLFDSDRRSAKSAAALSLEMRRLRDASVRVFIILGNHDAGSASLARTLDLPDNVHVFDGRGRPVELDDAPVAIHGVSFSARHAGDSLLPKYHRPLPERINIGLMHTSIDGSPGHDPYAPCSLAELIDHGFDYWALGHIHRRRVHHDHPAVVMPGIPQGRHINEAGACSVTLVDIEPGAPPVLQERSVRVAAFERVEIDVDGAPDRAAVLDRIDAAMRTLIADRTSEQLILRPRFTGRTDIAFELQDAPEQLLEEARGLARRHGGLAIEKLEIACDPLPTEAPDDNALPIDAFLDEQLLSGPAITALIDEEVERLRKMLPAAHRDLLGADADERRAVQQDALQAGVRRVRARLAGHADADR